MKQIVTHLSGSKAYGTDTPESDTDIRGIFCGDKKNILTPFYKIKQQTVEDEEDTEYWELHHYMNNYVLKQNPNMIETLWIDESDITQSHDAYWYLRENAENLLSKKVAFTYTGYAVAQLKRIKGHNKWINNPQPKEPPKHGQFLKLVQNFTDKKIMPRDFLLDHLNGFNIVHYGGDIFGVVREGGCNALTESGDFNISVKQVDGSSSREQPVFIIKYLKDEYLKAKDNHHNYWTWKNNRNEKRSKLEEKYGYDCKHAMHLVRLLRQGEEILKGQGVIVKRPDAKELLEIRDGAWAYDDLIKWAEEKDEYIRNELYNTSKLPKTPNLKLAADVLMTAQEMIWDK